METFDREHVGRRSHVNVNIPCTPNTCKLVIILQPSVLLIDDEVELFSLLTMGCCDLCLTCLPLGITGYTVVEVEGSLLHYPDYESIKNVAVEFVL